MQSILAMFLQWCHEDEEQYRRRIDNIKTVQAFVTPPDPTLFFTHLILPKEPGSHGKSGMPFGDFRHC